ncbi:hypothetical protein, unlikely [Trypanosoma brucei gambiense DAL972]|uniref:Uncharacterized protein n=1 Tax=Trypanosoma brucei gambiense (strain MHOM/CI/86/DAL972) TaxID=679716 RepID=C9ZVR2_TRYB9|nr:hypothetical protein, unlikely [Trypanosoma brucei gambiense DAL972]CBH13500.1 hypothetical protein, unlikely [Trypanosoma brucei gambiense DAL972]|eukprot:XP_011775777.1 hypothetical protein, unlikely [Trypanosoma brucei gambiense DAL972]
MLAVCDLVRYPSQHRQCVALRSLSPVLKGKCYAEGHRIFPPFLFDSFYSCLLLAFCYTSLLSILLFYFSFGRRFRTPLNTVVLSLVTRLHRLRCSVAYTAVPFFSILGLPLYNICACTPHSLHICTYIHICIPLYIVTSICVFTRVCVLLPTFT